MPDIVKPLVWLIGFLYYITVYQVFTLFGNLYWLTRILFSGKLPAILRQMKEAKARLVTPTMMTAEIAKFQYCYDGLTLTGLFQKWPTWQACMIVFFYRGLCGNCEEAANYSKWCFKQWMKVSKAPNTSMKLKVMIPYDTFLRVFKSIHFVTVMTNERGEDAVFSNGTIFGMPAKQFAVQFTGTNKVMFLF